jgi:molecular chaperone HtpG
VLDLLAKLAKDEPEKYQSFWKEFGAGHEGGRRRGQRAATSSLPLLRFASTHSDRRRGQTVRSRDYVARMKTGSRKIYYVIADSGGGAQQSVHREAARQKGIEVLLLSDRIDEWVMGQVTNSRASASRMRPR